MKKTAHRQTSKYFFPFIQQYTVLCYDILNKYKICLLFQVIGEREYAVRPTRRPSEELQTGQPLDIVIQQVSFLYKPIFYIYYYFI